MLRYTPRYTSVKPLPLSGPYPSWFSTLLAGRGIDTPEKAERFLHPDLADLHDPFLMQDMDKAISLIRQALDQHKRILVYGDYDVDGISAVSIMMENLRALGANVQYRLPDRGTEGYGLHSEIIRELAPETDLLLTVDCGITNLEEVQYARSLGLTVIVTDHHQPGEFLPEADAVLNPLLGSYPFRYLCGAGVALKVMQALRGNDAIVSSLDLAALATVADVVPLMDENRILVAYGLKKIEATERPGLKELIRLAGLHVPLTSTDVAFRIAPRLNAGGRLEGASQCVELLLSSDSVNAAEIAGHLEHLNTLRQETQRGILTEARKQMNETVNYRTDRIIIISGKDWNNGIIGLVAGKLCEETHFPTIVLSDHDGESVGSCRSVPGVNIYKILSSCKDLFVRFGGHEQAAGLTVRTELIPEMKRRLNAAVHELCDESCLVPEQEYDLPLRLEEVSPDMLSSLQLLEPCGCGNPAPLFLFKDCQVQERRRIGKDRTHLRMVVGQGKSSCGCIGFSMGSVADEDWTRVDLVAGPEANEYGGVTTLQLHLQSVRPAEGASDLPLPDRLFSAFLQDLSMMAAKKEGDPAAERINRNQTVSSLKKPFGTLLITMDRERALSLSQEAGCESFSRTVRDPRGFSSVLYLPSFESLNNVWQTVILQEADLWPGALDLIRERCPDAALKVLPSSGSVPGLVSGIRTDREQMGAVWLAIRKAPRAPAVVADMTGMDIIQVLFALAVFRELDLVTFGRDPMDYRIVPSRQGCQLENSPLIRYLRRIVPNSERKSV